MGWLLMKAGYLDMRHTLPVQLVLHGLLGLAVGAWWNAGCYLRWRWGVKRWGVMVLVVMVCVLPGAERVVTRPLVDRRFVKEAAEWIRQNSVSGTSVCDKEELVGYYSGREYVRWAGDPGDGEHPVDRLVGELAARRTAAHPHVICALIFEPKRGQAVRSELAGGTWREIARFESRSAVGGDTMVLYAARGDEVLK
jgi:hypothetical protein